MNEASLVKLCLPEPPTPTKRALPLGVLTILDIIIKFTMASWKNTKSMAAPRTASLYCSTNTKNKINSSTFKYFVCALHFLLYSTTFNFN